mgnify:CR=1 FL=1
MIDARERDYRRRAGVVEQTRFLPGTNIEIVREVRLEAPPKHALFDFDGTLSLIREGWPQVMVPMMVSVLKETGTNETPEQLREVARTFVMELNGKQTIYQMIRLAEEVSKRGGRPEDPLYYKKRYLDLLLERIRGRREALASGKASPEDMMVPGSRDILHGLLDRGVRIYLASGTDEEYVFEEARLLGLDEYFGSCVYGAIDDYRSFSKQMVIDRIFRENKVEGAALIGFGDGYVEIDNVKMSGGTAVAVASDEAGRGGKPDAWKRERLIGVGADIVIPDFRESRALLRYLWGEEGAGA